MKTRIFIGALGALVVAFLLSFGMAVKNAQADSILFPWIAKGGCVSTLISVVNTAEMDEDRNEELHYQYWHKITPCNGQCERCTCYSFKRPTSKDDIVTFDASGNISDGKALYGEEDYYEGKKFRLNVEAPRRAFLIVDNDDLDCNEDGTIYGEAMVLELSGGAAWGYIAYNPDGDSNDSFADSNDVLGEVIGLGEMTQTVLLAPDQGITRFFATPICDSKNSQRDGDIDGQMYLTAWEEQGIYDNDENVIDFCKKKNIVCTAIADLKHLIGEGAYNEFKDTGGQGWAYVKTTANVALSCSEVDNEDTDCSGMVIGKLKYTTAGITFGDTEVPGTFNNFLWLRDSSSWCGGSGINDIHNSYCDDLDRGDSGCVEP